MVDSKLLKVKSSFCTKKTMLTYWLLNCKQLKCVYIKFKTLHLDIQTPTNDTMKKELLIIFILVFAFNFNINAQNKTKENKEEKPTIARQSLLFSKYKSAWQVGVFGGASILMGDVKPSFLYGGKPALPGHNFGLFVSKSWTYLFSTRLRYSTMVMFTNAAKASTLTSNQYKHIEERSSGLNAYAPGDLFFHNSRTQAHDLTLDLVFSIGNVNFNKERSAVVFKVFPSVGAMMYQTFYDHLDASGNAYDYASVDNLNALGSNSRTDVYKKLASMRDGKYETKAEENTIEDENKIMGYNPRFVFGLGAGVAIRLTKFMSLDIETKQMLTRDDLIDGVQWQEPGASGTASSNLTRGFDSYNQTTLGLTFSIIGKNIAESKNMDNPLAGADAFSKNNDVKEETNAPTNEKLDSTNTALEKRVESLEDQINGLEMLIKMMGKAQEEKTKALEAEKDKLQQQANSLQGNNNENIAQNNDIEDPTFKLRNGKYIHIAELEGKPKAAYYLIIGSFRVKSNANKDQRNWKDKGINTVIMKDVKEGLYRLVVDYTNEHSTALDMLDEYQNKLDKDIWLIKAK